MRLVAITRGGTPQSSDPLGNPWMFTGRMFDEETGLYYYGARYYDPGFGRFMTADSMLPDAAIADAPIRLYFINTATQQMPRAAVLDSKRDAYRDEPYRMGHPSFVLEWTDGRLLLIDLCMTRERALSFGGPLQRFAEAKPIQTHESTMKQLGAAAKRLGGVTEAALSVDGAPAATIQIEQVYRRDREAESESVFGTVESAHPGVGALERAGDWVVGGTVRVFRVPAHTTMTPPRRRACGGSIVAGHDRPDKILGHRPAP